MEEKRKLIIDCDFGVDEGMALALLRANQDTLKLVAVSTVSGRVDAGMASGYIKNICEFYGIDVPVAKGMEEPLIKEKVKEADSLWKNGEESFQLPKGTRKVEDLHGIKYLGKILTELPEGEKLTLVTMGPLTNIAMVLKMFPEVKSKIQEIFIAGGAALGGDVTPSAEFNIFTDPEAAKILFGSGIPLRMFGLDVTNNCSLTRRQVLKLSQSPAPVPKLLGDMAGFFLEHTDDKYRGKISIHGAAPIMYLLYPEIFKDEKAIIDVDCTDGMSRGRTVCDLRWWMHSPEEMTSLVFMDVDETRFQEYLISALYDVGQK